MHEIYKDISIEYSESSNAWKVDDEKFGITLTSGSLADAKKGIDLNLKKQFKRFKAWKRGSTWRGDSKEFLVLVEVTSIIEEYRNPEAWITYLKEDGGKGSREKTYLSNLYVDSPANQLAAKEINDFDKQADELTDKRDKLVETLESVERG